MTHVTKHGIAFLMFCLSLSTSYSQTLQTYTVTGSVIDSVSKKQLDLVTAALKTKDNKPFKTTLTTDKGVFKFSNIQAGNYKLNLLSVGYKPVIIDVNTTERTSEIDFGVISLIALHNQLKEISITADRPLIKQEADRISYDVQADPESKLDNVLDVLRKVPLVSIDSDDNIQVKGSTSYKVLINGRASSLIAKNPKDVFKNMPANTIQRIEIITTPPAKYDSEGLAGIINIITNKKIDQGYNGSVTARYKFPFGPGVNSQLTIKGKKLGLSTNIGGNIRNGLNSDFNLDRTAVSTQSLLALKGVNHNSGKYMYSNAELSYEFDSLNLVTAELGYNYGDNTRNAFQQLNEFSANQSIAYGYNLNNTNKNDWKGYEAGLNYQLGFKRNKEQLLTGSYKFNKNNDASSSDFFITQRNVYDAANYGQNNQSGSDEQTMQLDYLHPVKKLNIEGGVKIILRNNFSNYQYGIYDGETNSSNYAIDDTRSNQFTYKQNVYSFYNSYQLKLNNWSLKSGLRLERTTINADFKTVNTPLKTDYTNFIPSLSLQRKLGKHSVNLGYTQRIERPSIWQLNPYVEQFNNNYTYSGNKNLKPVLNHTFDLNYSISKKNAINGGFNYMFANNTIQHVIRLLGNTSYATHENIGKNKNAGFNINTNQQLTKSFNVTINTRLSYIWMEGQIDGNTLSNEGIQGNVYTYVGYKLKNNWRTSVSAGYYSPWITLQGQSNSYYYTSASVNKEFFNKKATLAASVNNPFQKFRNWENNSSTTQFIQSERFQNYYRNYNLSLTYKFGKLNGSIKKNQRGINNDDVTGKNKE